MQRRRYLAVCGTAAAGLLAGCNQTAAPPADSQETVDGPAQFNNILINAPQEAAIDSEVSMTVSARNYGGQTGTYTDRLVAVDGDSDFAQDISIGNIPSGQTGEVEVNVPVRGAGEYRFELEEAGVAASVAVTAEAVEPGQMVDVGNNLQLTFTDVSFREGVYYRYVAESGYTKDMFTGGGGNSVLGVFRAKMKNSGSQPTRILPEKFSVDGGQIHATIDGKPLGTIEGLDGQPLLGSPIESGETVNGWVLASIPRETILNQGIGVGWSLKAGGGGRPDRVWSFPPRALAEFALVDFTMPDRPQRGRLEGTVTVRNVGQTGGTFTGLAEFNMKGRGWSPAAYPTGDVESGATKTFSFTQSWPFTQETVWRVIPFGASEHRRRITGGSQRLSFGDSTAAIDNSTVTVSNPRFMRTYGFTATESTEGGTSQQVTKQREPPEGRKFLFIDVTVTAGAAGGNTPQPDTFRAKVGDQNYQQYTGPNPTQPDVSLYSGMNNPDAGQEASGVLIFAVPADAQNASVQYREEFGGLTSDIVWS
ncbi:hypothetical protein [Halomarina oriensis]|uniref:DUF4352 domain-containing protein n=1 Tax=Halomarina oriensis TaxID=671145 RepID=A0A6B0GFU5_9EURY|nr:hypothetical protein [Halomarina oriensis]MWG33574.1 hypothetical protein [Halomarina oriensis]